MTGLVRKLEQDGGNSPSMLQPPVSTYGPLFSLLSLLLVGRLGGDSLKIFQGSPDPSLSPSSWLFLVPHPSSSLFFILATLPLRARPEWGPPPPLPRIVLRDFSWFLLAPLGCFWLLQSYLPQIRCIASLTSGAESLSNYVSAISTKIDFMKGIDDNDTARLTAMLGLSIAFCGYRFLCGASPSKGHCITSPSICWQAHSCLSSPSPPI